jgi:hypothetical protein
LLLQILSYIQLRNFPEFVERWYRTSIYPIISRAMQIAQGWILFSFGGLLYVVILIVTMRFLIVGFRELVTLSRKQTTQIFAALNTILPSFIFHGALIINENRLMKL